MTIDARIDHLRTLISTIQNEHARNDASGICDRLRDLVAGRNHLMYGVWGLFIDRKTNKPLPACFNLRSRERPIFATEVADMTRSTAEVSRGLGALLATLTPAFAAGVPPRRFFFSDGPPTSASPPDWSA
jgi:hypothetical protein